MKSERRTPPPIICTNDRFVVLYANLDKSIPHRPATVHLYVAGKELAWMPHVAIAEDAATGTFSLYVCDRKWKPIGIGGGCATLEEAAARADKLYPGVSTLWIEASFTDEDVERFREEQFGKHRCVICRKRPDEVLSDVTFKSVHDGWICSNCG
jgi:hypothetical protein